MISIPQIILFLVATAGITWVSRSALRDPRSHGFYRFFAWETILVLFLINVAHWFQNPFAPRQIVSWTFLLASLALIIQGVQAFRTSGKVDNRRNDPALVGIEKATALVTTGVYRMIRHPFYSSLLFLAWGILLKHVTWIAAALALTAAALLVMTARREEAENLQYFGEPYRAYMRQTHMFIPYLF